MNKKIIMVQLAKSINRIKTLKKFNNHKDYFKKLIMTQISNTWKWWRNLTSKIIVSLALKINKLISIKKVLMKVK